VATGPKVPPHKLKKNTYATRAHASPHTLASLPHSFFTAGLAVALKLTACGNGQIRVSLQILLGSVLEIFRFCVPGLFLQKLFGLFFTPERAVRHHASPTRYFLLFCLCFFVLVSLKFVSYFKFMLTCNFCLFAI
jgi:hypothetical protein